MPAFELAPDVARKLGLCIHCGLPALERCTTAASRREYHISVLCEVCFDAITDDDADTLDYVQPLPDETPSLSENIPAPILDALRRYVRERIETDSFLRACLENNLTHACALADDRAAKCLSHILRWIYNAVPNQAWGTPAKVEAWLNGA